MKKIFFCIFFFYSFIFCYGETWDQLLSRTELVQRRVTELIDQIAKVNPNSDEYYQLAGRIQTSSEWLTEQWDSLIIHFSSTWSQQQKEEAIKNSDYWNKIDEHYNDLGYSLLFKRIDLGVDKLHELEMMKLGSTRSMIELDRGGSRP
jgi:acyl carrier protein phosphodiesterase